MLVCACRRVVALINQYLFAPGYELVGVVDLVRVSASNTSMQAKVDERHTSVANALT